MATVASVERAWAKSFRTPMRRTAWFSSIVMEYCPRDRPVRILDLGCGTGDVAASLACSLPHASLTALDISRTNIETAERLTSDPKIANRLNFACTDYLEYRAPQPFDLIVSDSALHFVPGSTDRLFAKLSSELAPGGQLVVSMPYRCAFNAALAGARWLLRQARGRWSDRLVFHAALALHGHQMPPEMLRERVHYLYQVHHRWLSARLVAQLQRCHNLQHVADRRYPHATLGQAKHRVAVFCKPANAFELGSGH